MTSLRLLQCMLDIYDVTTSASKHAGIWRQATDYYVMTSTAVHAGIYMTSGHTKTSRCYRSACWDIYMDIYIWRQATLWRHDVYRSACWDIYIYIYDVRYIKLMVEEYRFTSVQRKFWISLQQESRVGRWTSRRSFCVWLGSLHVGEGHLRF